jgi:hypothetical protein
MPPFVEFEVRGYRNVEFEVLAELRRPAHTQHLPGVEGLLELDPDEGKSGRVRLLYLLSH